MCGHRLQHTTEKGQLPSAYPSEILPGFLYLGSYDNASRCELLKAMDITHILNVRRCRGSIVRPRAQRLMNAAAGRTPCVCGMRCHGTTQPSFTLHISDLHPTQLLTPRKALLPL